MKKVIPVILILLIMGVTVYNYVNKDRIPAPIVEQEETQYGDILIPENLRLSSVYELKGKKEILKYLDPSEMTNYEDLVTLYVSFLLKTVTDNPTLFYETNIDGIRNYLGIYNLKEFLVLNSYLIDSGVTENSVIDYIELIGLEKEGNLLRSTIFINLNNANLELSHCINYVYIDNINYLFLYSNSN